MRHTKSPTSNLEHQVKDGTEALLGKKVDLKVEFNLLVFDTAQQEPGIGNAKPGLRVLRPKLKLTERASIVVVGRLVLVGLSPGSPIVVPNTRMKEVNTSVGRDRLFCYY